MISQSTRLEDTWRSHSSSFRVSWFVQYFQDVSGTTTRPCAFCQNFNRAVSNYILIQFYNLYSIVPVWILTVLRCVTRLPAGMTGGHLRLSQSSISHCEKLTSRGRYRNGRCSPRIERSQACNGNCISSRDRIEADLNGKGTSRMFFDSFLGIMKSLGTLRSFHLLL